MCRIEIVDLLSMIKRIYVVIVRDKLSVKLLKKLHRVRATGDILWFSFQSAAGRVARATAEIWGAEYSEATPPPSMKRYNFEEKPPTMS